MIYYSQLLLPTSTRKNYHVDNLLEYW